MRTIIASLLLAVAGICQGATFEANPDRTIFLTGPIGGEAIQTANRIERMSRDGEPIDMVISSPGGSVHAGLAIVEAMGIAKARGVPVRCVVTHLAASMAFQIFTACSERYTLPRSLLLWHYGRISGMFTLTSRDLVFLGEDLGRLDARLSAEARKAIGISAKLYDYHALKETLWTAQDVLELPGASKFFTIVDELRGVNPQFMLFGWESADLFLPDVSDHTRILIESR